MDRQNPQKVFSSPPPAVSSHEPLERPKDVRENYPGNPVQTPDGGAASRRPGRPGPDQGLRQLSPSSLQETRIQELPKHIPALRHPPPLQHPVSVTDQFLFNSDPGNTRIRAGHVP